MNTPPGVPGQPTGPTGEPAALATCVRHPDRPTGLRCSRCDRPACPDCLREASVGYHCVDCVAGGRSTTRQWRAATISGARPQRRPIMVPILILVNLVVFVVTVAQAHSLGNNAVSPLFFQWAMLPKLAANGYWWQFITAGFLHYGPIHIAMNMIARWIIGKDLEQVLGLVRFSVVYLVSLFGGSVSVFLFSDPLSQVAGASGAVFGLMGGLLVVVYRLKLNPGSVIGLIAINLALSVAIPGISLLGHVGGLVVGALVTAAMVFAPAARRMLVQVGAVVLAVVLLLGLVFVREAQLAEPGCLPEVSSCSTSG